MRPIPFTWPYALIFWAVYLWAFAPEFGIIRRAQRPGNDRPSRDPSLQVILIGMGFAIMAAFFLAFVRVLQFPLQAMLPAFWIGVLLLIGGSLLRRHCWRILGEWFTGDVRARAEQPVIDRGAYRWVRHPSYTAGILMVLGIGVALGNWGSAILPTAITAACYGYRIVVEERALTATLGDRYVTFARTRKRLIPFIV
jgi:protein-S-isoprenylcysteine O-methyltransferase Ste14